MGQGASLSPSVLIESVHGFNNHVSYATSDIMGYRREMEDEHISKCQMAKNVGCFAVFDGHGGSTAVTNAAKIFPQHFFSSKEKSLRVNIDSDEEIKRTFLDIDRKVCSKIMPSDMSGTTFVGAFILYNPYLEKKISSKPTNPNNKRYNSLEMGSPNPVIERKRKKIIISSGGLSPGGRFPLLRGISTGSMSPSPSNKRKFATGRPSLVSIQNAAQSLASLGTPKNSGSKLFSKKSDKSARSSAKKKRMKYLNGEFLDYQVTIMNAGDSRCIICRGKDVVFSSKDHKPTDQSEKSRINRAGMDVIQGRIDGMLAVSRGFGDKTFKSESKFPLHQQPVSPVPVISRYSVRVEKTNLEYNFMVLACDGVFDVMSNREVAHFVSYRLSKFSIFDTQKKISRSEWLQRRDLWCYTRVQKWNHKQVQDWIESAPDVFKELIPRKLSSGAALMNWANETCRKSKGATNRQLKLYKHIQHVDNQIRKTLSRPDPQTTSEKIRCITELLVHECVLNRRSQDNCTATIVLFHHPKFVQESATLMKNRAKLKKRSMSVSVDHQMHQTYSPSSVHSTSTSSLQSSSSSTYSSKSLPQGISTSTRDSPLTAKKINWQ